MMTMPALASHAYRAAASATARLVAASPSLERPFIRLGSALWDWPGAGRFYRSAIDRYADELRATGSTFRRITVDGVPMVFDVTEFTTSNLFFAGRPYEPSTTEFLRERLVAGSAFVDIGANHGYFTVFAAARVGPTGSVTAFEPNPPVRAQLLEHVRLNGFADRVVVRDEAVADGIDREAPLYVSQWRRNSGVSTIAPNASAVAEGAVSLEDAVLVRVTSFDAWFEASGLSRVDVVKIDAEGAEDRVVAGMRRALASHVIGAVVCETTDASAAHRQLCAAGLVPRALDVAGPLTNYAYARD
jgi:FkbM family methyltransferase